MAVAGMGRRLQQGREAKRFTLDFVARCVGKHVRTVKRWEQEITKPSIEDVDLLSRLYGVTPTHLLHGEEEAA
jgi:transcriptional regulator with XRE-family HTH domain